MLNERIIMDFTNKIMQLCNITLSGAQGSTRNDRNLWSTFAWVSLQIYFVSSPESFHRSS